MKELRILNGTRKGVSLLVDDEPVKIGSSLQSELILNDEGVEAEHLQIGLLNDTEANLICISGRITTISGAHKRGEIRLRNGVPFKLGSIWLVIQDQDKPWPTKMPTIIAAESSPKIKRGLKDKIKRGLKDKIKRGLKDRRGIKEKVLNQIVAHKYIFRISLLGLILIGARTFANSPNDVSQMESQQPTLSSEKPLDDPASKVGLEKLVPENSALIERAKTVVKKMLEERDLTDVVVSSSQGSIHLKGFLSRSDKKIFERMLLRYQTDHANLPRVIDKSEDLIAELPFSIVSIISGPFGHIVTKDGERLSTGQEKQGYTLVAIEKNRLVFDGEQRIQMSW